MNGKTVIGLGIAAAGAYLLYSKGMFDEFLDKLGIDAVGGQEPAGNNNTSNGGNGSNTNTSGNNNASNFDLKAAMVQAAAMRNFAALMTFEEWNWLYSQVRGVPGPAPEDVPQVMAQGKDKKITLDEWIGYVSPMGLNGLGMLYGASGISPYVSMGRGNLYDWRLSRMYNSGGNHLYR